jgi:hypothetical protein
MLSASATDDPPNFCTIKLTTELLKEKMMPARTRGRDFLFYAQQKDG